MSVTKTITTSKPFYVVAGAGDLAVKTLREGTERLSAIRLDRAQVESTIASLQSEAKALPAKAQTAAVTLVADAAGRAGTGYDELVGRGRSVVTRIRRQKATQELTRQAATTIRRSKATLTSVAEGATDTRSAARGTATTAKKRAATTKKTAKSAATSARKTASAAKQATADAADKTGQ
jgi:hypothetical protein